MGMCVCLWGPGGGAESLGARIADFVSHQIRVLGSKLWPVAQMGAISPVLLLLFPDWAAVGTLV